MVPELPPKSDSGREASQQSEEKLGSEFPVVAVGASAGGLEAFTRLLQHLPADTGMAFVFIQHLAPSHESMLAQLLSRHTAMQVNSVEHGAILSPNQVYVIPPNVGMTISGLALALKPRTSAGTVIDGFLRSLAESRKGGAIAVILSGTGSDGTLGVQAIAEEGGLVFAQEPGSADFDSMPRSAIATGCVDFVLPIEGIAAELARIAHEPRLVQRKPPGPSGRFAGSEKEYQEIIEMLRAGTGVDFNLYRQTTFRRRVLRRAALLRKGSVAEYKAYLRENPDELHTLAQDVLIRVTHFFRDPEVFEVLIRRVFPALIRKTPLDRAVRVWVPGCSTGEEAYSIAICFLEVAEQMQSQLPLQIFATDINEAALEKARRGRYIRNIAADVSPERLARFFVGEGNEFRIVRKLRDLCVFSRHDLLNDPPFSRMGLISCRNVLIYLDSRQQGYAFSNFHFALNPGGFLLLGRSERPASATGLFSPLDKQASLYVRQESLRYSGPATVTKVHVAEAVQQSSSSRKLNLHRLADRVLVERYSPPSVIVNAELEIVTKGGETGGFVPETRNEKVFELVKNAQSAALKDAIQTARKDGRPVRLKGIKLGEIVTPREVNVEVTPLGAEGQDFLAVFEEQFTEAGEKSESEGSRSSEEGNPEARIRQLEKELASSRARLDSLVTEQEAAHEEVVAGNAEMASINEELESAKEELEATNEELTTVNQELRVRNRELEKVNEFAQATIDTVRGSLVVLGPDLRVLKANESFYRAFGLSRQDVEHRFIYEVGDGVWSIPRLRVLLEEVLPERRNMTDFEMEQALPSGAKRILLLNAHRFEHEERILLAMEDVTERKRVEEDLRQSQKMEAIGYLAAGVAHDFNNLLTGVIGNASLVLQNFPENQAGRAALENVISGGQRAAELTRQLLAYAGKSRFLLERIDLSDVVMQTSKLIHPSIPHDVQVRLDLDKHLPRLLADPAQVQQVVMNLMINAVEAIGARAGFVQVRTGPQKVTSEPLPDVVPNQKVVPGDYVFLEVRDNGVGMDEQTIKRSFDPFFTTKFTGRGLGLGAVLGIVRQQKGLVQVHSVPGRGTSFRILFPVAEMAQEQAAEGEASRQDLRGSGTILVADDEELIRNFTKSALEPYGYNVLMAEDGAEAVRLVKERAGEIALVLLDVAMPGMDGIETLERIREVRADIPIMICSGLGDVDIESRFAAQQIASFLWKPYTVKQLAERVKGVLSPPKSL